MNKFFILATERFLYLSEKLDQIGEERESIIDARRVDFIRKTMELNKLILQVIGEKNVKYKTSSFIVSNRLQ